MENKSIDSEIQKLNLKDLKSLLKNIKLYEFLNKKLWVRGRALFEMELTWKKEMIVEYFPSISEDLAYEKAKVIYEKTFSLRDVVKEDIKFIPKPKLLWGIKVYLDDSLLDISFSRIEKLIK